MSDTLQFADSAVVLQVLGVFSRCRPPPPHLHVPLSRLPWLPLTSTAPLPHSHYCETPVTLGVGWGQSAQEATDDEISGDHGAVE